MSILLKGLGDSKPVFEIVRTVVKKLPTEQAMEFLDLGISNRSSPSIRKGAVVVLQEMKSVDATERILQVYERDIEVDEVRNAARDSLRELRQFLPLQEIVREARSGDKHSRARALKLLGVVGGDIARTTLQVALDDPELYHRGTAVLAVAELGERSMIAKLERMQQDTANKRIAHLIRHTLKQLRQQQDTSK
jgi:HEAT repeat protein